MTPLAHRFARELTLPRANRSISDRAHVLDRLEDLHCFDISAIWIDVNAAMDEQNVWPTVEVLLPDTFLPSPRTWLEAPFEVTDSLTGKPCNRGRIALMVEFQGPWLHIDLAMCSSDAEPWSGPLGRIRAGEPLEQQRLHLDSSMLSEEARKRDLHLGVGGIDGSFNRFAALVVLMLDIINTPALVHLRAQKPHRGLQRALERSAPGRYPLRAWHEVVIKPQDRPLTADEEATEHMTGRKCLHFVRAHRRRYVDGNETLVRHHWRGDPALGMARTRYRVEG